MTTRRRRRGFSLLEVMVSAAILGIGVLAAVRLFTASADGTGWTKSRNAAVTLAMQRLEHLGTQGIDQLPNCVGPTACQLGPNILAPPLANAGAFACTQQVTEMTSDLNLANPNGKFRVDTVVAPHPDVARQPNARIVTISVCWSDDQQVHQAQLDRLFIPDV